MARKSVSNRPGIEPVSLDLVNRVRSGQGGLRQADETGAIFQKAEADLAAPAAGPFRAVASLRSQHKKATGVA